MIIDFEHHYIPAELGQRLGLDPSRKEAVRTRDASVHSQLFDMEAQLRDMDRAGIDVAVQTCILGWDTTVENCRLLNDCTAQLQKDWPSRFVGLAHAQTTSCPRPVGGAAARTSSGDAFSTSRQVGHHATCASTHQSPPSCP